MQSREIGQLEEISNQVYNIKNLFNITLDYIDNIPTLERVTQNKDSIYNTCRLAEPNTVLAYQIYCFLYKLDEDINTLIGAMNGNKVSK